MDAAAQSITKLCSELLESCAARAVCVVGANDDLIAVAPESMRSVADDASAQLEGAAGSQMMNLGDGLCTHLSHAGPGWLVVIFDSQTSLGLVKLRVRSKLDELERLFPSDGGHTPQGSGGHGGSPPATHAAFSVGDLDEN